MELLEHHFHPDIAKEYGINIAIFLRDIYHWCTTNRNNDENFYEGRWWTYQTMKGLCQRHPYWSKNQVEYIIRTCKEKGLLLSGHFGEDRFNRTCWYALTDKGIDLFNPSNPISENSEVGFGKNYSTELKIQKCNKDKDKTENITDNPNPTDRGEPQEIFEEATSAISQISSTDDAGALRNAIVLCLDQKGFSCRHMVPTPQRSPSPDYTGRLNILATKKGISIGIEVDRKSPREKSIFKLRNYPCDYRIIVLRTGESQPPPAGIDAVIAIHAVQSDSMEILGIFDTYAEGDTQLRQLLDDFAESRRKGKSPLQTERQARLLLSNLDKHSGGNRDYKIALLEKAILLGWKGIYPLKPGDLPPEKGDQPLRGEGVRYL